MSTYQAFRRAAVPPQAAQQLETTTIPAPTRGIIMDENETFMQPGAAVVCDNWKPTLRGVSLRGGCIRWCVLPETTPVISAFRYASGNNQNMYAGNATKLYDVTTSAPTVVKSGQTSGNYCASQMANQGGDWMVVVNDNGDAPLRFNGSTWATLNFTTPANWANSTAYAVNARAKDTADGSLWKCAVAHTSATSGTFLADRTAHPSYWITDVASDGVSWITGPTGSTVINGGNLTYVCKYRGRLFFIEGSSMNAWYLPLNAVGGLLAMIPLSGAATKGGKLLFCASWSIDAGDGIDDKLVFCTDLGELLIFTGSDPSNASNWRQEGRYQIPPPMGMNAHLALGGELLIATTQGIVPCSAAITKSPEDLELANITRAIKPMWRDEVNAKRQWSWTMFNWEIYGGIFVTWPGSVPGYCAVVNASTGAWARFVGYDATCFIQLRDDMFFGTQNGIIMQADRTGYDDGLPYTAVLVGGWEMFQAPSQTITWRQARASFAATQGQPFQPQLAATTDYVVTLPPPPPAGPDPGIPDAWDEGLWGPDMGPPPPPVPTPAERTAYAQWDQTVVSRGIVRNTGWVSIGVTGFSHAPVVQVTVAQQAKPNVDLISIAATFERAGINV
jgi:hypothetical protein